MTALASRGVRLALAAAALVLATPLSASAETGVSIDHVESDGGAVDLVLSVDQLPAGVTPDAGDVTVTVDGEQVDADVQAIDSGTIERTTVLVLDASNSMRAGGKFDAARSAVDTFLQMAPPDVRIGLVTFADDVRTIAPTTDHAAIAAALEETTLAKGTSVYDAILAGTDALGTDGSRSLLVLSDGADTNSTATLEDVAARAADDEVVVDVVSLAQGDRADELSGLAADSNGTVVPSDPASLSTVFSSQAEALARQLVVSFAAPEGASGDARLEVTVDAGGQQFSDSTLASVSGGSGGSGAGLTVVESGRSLVSKPVMLVGALALGLGLAGILATVLTGADTRPAAARRLDDYFAGGDGGDGGKGRGRGKRADAAARPDLRTSAVAITDKVVTADLETRISQRLTGAGSALTAAEWLLIHAGIAIGSAAVGFLLGGAFLGFLALLGGALVPWIYLRFRHKRRLNKFNADLAQSLSLMAGGLQAGLSLPQAVDTVVREGNEPIAGEFRRALVEQRLGIDITDALEGVGQRMESQDFSWVVMAIRIQREVGGNLAEILHTVSETLREREYLRRQVRSLSAEGRMSAWILGALPVGMFGYMIMANREYVQVMWTTPIGWAMLAAALFLLILGSTMMGKMTKVEV